MSNWQNRIIGIENIDPKTIKKNPINYKTHPETQERMMGGVLKEIGWIQSVIVNKRTGNLIDGHMRVDLAIENSEKSIPVVFIDLSEEEEIIALSSFDPVTSFAKEKKEKIKNLLDSVKTNNIELVELLEKVAKRNRIEYNSYTPEDEKNSDREKKIAEYESLEELTKKWGVSEGNRWIIKSNNSSGNHVLVCGDSSDINTINKLCGEVKGTLFSTDPPYGINFKGQKFNPKSKNWDGINGDNISGNDLREWFSDILKKWIPYMDERGAYYIWSAIFEDGFAIYYAIKDAGLHIQSQIMWEKDIISLGQADYQWKHENCWYAFMKGKKHYWNGERNQSTVWKVNKIKNKDYLHPMQKPEELYCIPIKNHTKPGDICLDPFCGSGTQIIAAETLGRICYGIEKDPKWVATSLERFVSKGLKVELE